MADNKIHMPGAFGGLMRYDEEYNARFLISPTFVVGLIVALIVFIIILKVFFPTLSPTSNAIAPGSPVTPHGVIISLLNLI